MEATTTAMGERPRKIVCRANLLMMRIQHLEPCGAWYFFRWGGPQQRRGVWCLGVLLILNGLLEYLTCFRIASQIRCPANWFWSKLAMVLFTKNGFIFSSLFYMLTSQCIHLMNAWGFFRITRWYCNIYAGFFSKNTSVVHAHRNSNTPHGVRSALKNFYLMQLIEYDKSEWDQLWKNHIWILKHQLWLRR
jgi:hypothetical protein